MQRQWEAEEEERKRQEELQRQWEAEEEMRAEMMRQETQNMLQVRELDNIILLILLGKFFYSQHIKTQFFGFSVQTDEIFLVSTACTKTLLGS